MYTYVDLTQKHAVTEWLFLRGGCFQPVLFAIGSTLSME